MGMRERIHLATFEHNENTVKRKQATNKTGVFWCVVRAVQLLQLHFTKLWKLYHSIFLSAQCSCFFLDIFSFFTVMVFLQTKYEPYSYAFTDGNIYFSLAWGPRFTQVYCMRSKLWVLKKAFEPHTTNFIGTLIQSVLDSRQNPTRHQLHHLPCSSLLCQPTLDQCPNLQRKAYYLNSKAASKAESLLGVRVEWYSKALFW